MQRAPEQNHHTSFVLGPFGKVSHIEIEMINDVLSQFYFCKMENLEDVGAHIFIDVYELQFFL